MTLSRPNIALPLLLVLSLLLLAPFGAGAQDTPASFGEVVDVDLVNVEVWVTDRKGQPILGLTPEDFIVREDGKPVEIAYFSEVSMTQAATQTARPQAIETETAAAAAAPADTGGDLSYLVLYFDDLHLRPSGRKNLISDLKEFLKTQSVPAERIMVVRQNEDLLIEVPFGSSRATIEKALEDFKPTPPISAQIEREKRLSITRLQDLWQQTRQNVQIGDPCETYIRQADAEVERYSREGRVLNATTLRHLDETASFLAGVPGLKTILYLSDALETSPGISLISFVESICPETRDGGRMSVTSDGLGEPFRRLTRHANANRVTIYAMQPSGLRFSVMSVAELGALDLRSSNQFSSELRQNERSGLEVLARETGGRAIFNKNKLEGELQDIGEEMSTYYSLAYYPTHGGDGLDHRIDVELKAKGLRLRHRQGYRDKSATQRMSERLESTLYLGLMSNPLEVRLGAGQVRPKGGKFVLPLHIVIPKDRVTFLPGPDGDNATIQVLISARNLRNQRTVSEQKVYQVPSATVADTESIAMVIPLPMAVGVHVVAVALRDQASQETSYISTSLEIQEPADSASGS